MWLCYWSRRSLDGWLKVVPLLMINQMVHRLHWLSTVSFILLERSLRKTIKHNPFPILCAKSVEANKTLIRLTLHCQLVHGRRFCVKYVKQPSTITSIFVVGEVGEWRSSIHLFHLDGILTKLLLLLLLVLLLELGE